MRFYYDEKGNTKPQTDLVDFYLQERFNIVLGDETGNKLWSNNTQSQSVAPSDSTLRNTGTFGPATSISQSQLPGQASASDVAESSKEKPDLLPKET